MLWFENLGFGDIAIVGEKNTSLGELFSRLGNAGVKIPGEFAT